MSEVKLPIKSIVGVGPTMAVLTHTGDLFVLGRASDDPKSVMQWDYLDGPTAADLERGLSSEAEKAQGAE